MGDPRKFCNNNNFFCNPYLIYFAKKLPPEAPPVPAVGIYKMLTLQTSAKY